ncbi:MAG: metallophosphoesterase [Pirellulales bacterium]|nr:metallophosphoesterase [Pirellulales bacterium]
MRLLCLTDLHGSRHALERILAAAPTPDLILLGGDLTDFGSPDDAQTIVQQAQASGVEVLAVAGNCDSAEIERRLTELGVALNGRGLVCQAVALQGLSAMPPWLSRMYHFTEDELAGLLEAGYAPLDGTTPHVVLSHAPPRDVLDRTARGKHVGSTALRAFVQRTQPALVVCGHIHEARGVGRLGPTTVVNCGPAASGLFATVEIGEALRVELHEA